MEPLPYLFFKLKELFWRNVFECVSPILENRSWSASYHTHPIFDLLGSLFYDVSALVSFIKVAQNLPLKLKEFLIWRKRDRRSYSALTPNLSPKSISFNWVHSQGYFLFVVFYGNTPWGCRNWLRLSLLVELSCILELNFLFFFETHQWQIGLGEWFMGTFSTLFLYRPCG